MAQLRSRRRSCDENVNIAAPGRCIKPSEHAEEPVAKRRALGDVSNVKGPSSNTRSQACKTKAQQQQRQQPRPQPSAAAAQQTTAPATEEQLEQQQVQRQQPRQQQRSRSRPPAYRQRRSSAANSQPQPAAEPPGRITRARSRTSVTPNGRQRMQSAVPAAASAAPPTEAAAAATAAAASREPLPDIDSVDRWNPLAVGVYVNDLYRYYRRAEKRFQVPSTYMARQTDINVNMRAILIDWLVEVHFKFKLLPETLFLTVNLIDRYLAVASVGRDKLQLVGTTAMLIASKYEEVWAPEVKDFVFITDNAYSRDEILAMEKDILQGLGYNLTLATIYQYLARLLKAIGVQYNKQLCLFVAYCAELCLVDYSMLRYSYTEQAAGVMYTALSVFEWDDPYPNVLECYAFQPRAVAQDVAQDVLRLLVSAPHAQLQGVAKKYSTDKFCRVASIPIPQDVLAQH